MKAGRLLAEITLFVACGDRGSVAPCESDCQADAAAEQRDATPKQEQPVIADGPAWLEIGRGEASFEPLPNDGAVVVLMGPQSSWMTLLGLRGNGFAPTQARVAFFGRVEDDLVANLQQRSDFQADGQDYVATGLALLFDPDVEMAAMLGQAMELDVELTDANGATVSASATLRPTM